MAKQNNDALFQLIKSLTKSEKRNFKLYAKRINDLGDTKFIQLFDAIDKLSEYDEIKILSKVSTIKKSQLANLKLHLYKQLLLSLRLLHINHDIDIQIREEIDYSRILYNKGLYKQSLKLLEKSKQKAVKFHRDSLLLAIVQREKIIELQYITRSVGERAGELSKESNDILSRLSNTNIFSNLALKLYDLYLKVGYIKNEKDYLMVKEFFSSNLPVYEESNLGFEEKLYLYQSQVWYYYIIQDFIMCYRYAQKWLDLFKLDIHLIEAFPILYLKGSNILLNSLFYLNKTKKFQIQFKELEDFKNSKQAFSTDNVKLLYFEFHFTHLINKNFLTGNFSGGVIEIEKHLHELETISNYLDDHIMLNLYYKIACLYFGCDNYKKSIFYLNKIINHRDLSIREDLHCFARILNLICHYEIGNDIFIQYYIKNTYRFLGKMKDLHLVQQKIFKFLRKLTHIYPNNLKSEFINLKNELNEITKNPFEKRPFLYLDILSWLESKITDKSVEQIIKENGLGGFQSSDDI